MKNVIWILLTFAITSWVYSYVFKIQSAGWKDELQELKLTQLNTLLDIERANAKYDTLRARLAKSTKTIFGSSTKNTVINANQNEDLPCDSLSSIIYQLNKQRSYLIAQGQEQQDSLVSRTDEILQLKRRLLDSRSEILELYRHTDLLRLQQERDYISYQYSLDSLSRILQQNNESNLIGVIRSPGDFGVKNQVILDEDSLGQDYFRLRSQIRISRRTANQMYLRGYDRFTIRLKSFTDTDRDIEKRYNNVEYESNNHMLPRLDSVKLTAKDPATYRVDETLLFNLGEKNKLDFLKKNRSTWVKSEYEIVFFSKLGVDVSKMTFSLYAEIAYL